MTEESWRTQLARLRLPLVIGGVSILLVIVSVVLLIKSVQTTTPIQFSSSASESGVLGQYKGQITVDIEGAVANPGIYNLPDGSRVEDAILAAGGLTNEADGERIAKTINRAAKLSDGAKLYILKEGDTSHNISIPSNSFDPSYPSAVSVNAASQSELEALAGIGPVTAKKIIAGRPWQTLEELVTKKAMSQSLYEKLKDQLTL